MAAMEDVLDLYEEPYDPMRPVVCFDESPKQLIAEVREPLHTNQVHRRVMIPSTSEKESVT